MPVDLIPPITSNPHVRRWGGVPLTSAPRYVTTDTRDYWHRVRSGVAYPERSTWNLWCGGYIRPGDATTSDNPPGDGKPVCGTCEGRAIGAGQDDNNGPVDLAFTPRRLFPPAVCPGVTRSVFEEIRYNVGRCLACRELLPIRAAGGPYNPRIVIIRHKPSASLVPPCPFHAWQYLAVVDGLAACGACAKGSRR